MHDSPAYTRVQQAVAQRDIELVILGAERVLVIGCDSLAGIGPRNADQIPASNHIVGRFTARVALMEVLSTGARPIAVINTLGVGMERGGREILDGIQQEAGSLTSCAVSSTNTTPPAVSKEGAPIITGSTEENVLPIQTSLGVTAIGSADISRLRIGTTKKGALLIVLGVPLVGEEVDLDDKRLTDLPLIRKLLTTEGVQEMLPVGSRGIAHEAEVLARSAGCRAKLHSTASLPLAKSAGPGTCLLVSARDEKTLPHLERCRQPVQVIGSIE